MTKILTDKNLIENQFSRNAETYNNYNIIQNKVVKELIGLINDEPSSILDIGCGTGSVYKEINWELIEFIGIDFSQDMLDKHPDSNKIFLSCQNFNNRECLNKLKRDHHSRVISASALQWANNLDRVFNDISHLNAPVSFSIFTSGTFKTLHQTAKVNSPLRNKDEIELLAKKYFNADFKLLTYQLKFTSIREMLLYIKKSGVSGGKNRLSYKEMKQLINNYPLDYLEFEILIIHENHLKR